MELLDNAAGVIRPFRAVVCDIWGVLHNGVSVYRDAESALGQVSYEVKAKDIGRRRSLFASEDIKKGDEFNEENVRSVRPGAGLHPKRMDDLKGKVALNDIKKGSPIRPDMFEAN